MEYRIFQLQKTPALESPVAIVGLRGWGNALGVSSAMATYVVDSLSGRAIGRIEPDACYRYDETRPVVEIASGRVKSLNPPGGGLFAVETESGQNDLLVLVADEPNLNWNQFSHELVRLALDMGARELISLGSMFDNVLHTDRIISAAATGDDHAETFGRHGVLPINYHGPSAIHTLLLDACQRQNLSGASLWCHCPAYLQGITHHGIMLSLARLLAEMGGFQLETLELQSRWNALKIQIKELVAENPKLEGIMDEIRKKKRQGAWQNLNEIGKENSNVISLQDFIDS
jgi:proteasome assembly chaperone (PAC2) family protein